MTNTGGAGYEYTPQPVAWTTRDALLFAISIGVHGDDLRYTYELDPQFQVFPTFPSVLSARGVSNEIANFYKRPQFGISEPIKEAPPLDIKKMVDAGRTIEMLKPLPASSKDYKFELRGRVLGVYDKGKAGTVVSTETVLVEVSSGDIYTRLLGNYFYVGQGGWGGPKGPASVKYSIPQRPADATYDIQVTPGTAALYRLNGDSNPLHIDPEVGKTMGFGGPIVHGLFSWNAAAYALLRQWGGGNAANMKTYEVKFSSPVKFGQTVVVKSWATGNYDKSGFQEILFMAEIRGGKECLSNGRAFIKVPTDSKL